MYNKKFHINVFFKFFFVLLITVLSFSCKNFLAGDKLQKMILEEIDFVNAKKITLTLENESDTGVLSDYGKNECKVGYNFNLSFEPNNENYLFLGWTCIDTETRKDASSHVEFQDILAQKTSVKILSDGNITVIPKCALRPKVKKFSPEYDVTGIGVAKNTSIYIELEKTIDLPVESSEIENYLRQILIETNGNVNRKFKPGISENVITFVSTDLIDCKTGTQEVSVKIPGSFYYTTKNVKGEDVRVYLSGEYSENNPVYETRKYLINNTTSTNTEIYFSADSDSGKLDFTGNKTLYIGDAFTVTFAKNSKSSFSGWSISAEGYTQEELIEALGITEVYDESTDRYIISGTVGKEIKGVKISPVTYVLPQALSVSPELSITGVSCTTSIVIQFNKKVNLSDFVDSSTNKMKNIKIESETKDYVALSDGETPYFELPVLSADGKTMVISTNKNRRLLDTSDFSAYIDLTVTLLTGEQKNNAGNVIRAALKSGEDNYTFEKDISWSYRVNSTTEVYPQFVNFIAATSTDFESTVLPGTDKSKWVSDAEYTKYHTNGTVYFTGLFSASNGVKHLKIVETVVEDVSGNGPKTSTGPYYVSLNSAQETVENTYSLNSGVSYKLNSKEDGIVKLDITLVDKTGLESQVYKTFYAIKDTTVIKPVVHAYTKLPFNDSGVFGSENMKIFDQSNTKTKAISGMVSTTISEIQNNLYKIYWKYEPTEEYWLRNKKDIFSTSNFIIKWGNSREYTYSSDIISSYSIETDSINSECNFTIPVDNPGYPLDTDDNIFYGIFYKDSIGNMIEAHTGIIGNKPVKTEGKSESGCGYTYGKWHNPLGDYSNKILQETLIYAYRVVNNQLQLCEVVSLGDTFTHIVLLDNGSYTYYFQAVTAVNNTEFKKKYVTYGNLSKPYVVNKNEYVLCGSEELGKTGAKFSFEATYERGEPNSGTYYVTVKIPKETYDSYDFMNVVLGSSTYGIGGGTKYAVEKCEDTYAVSETVFTKDGKKSCCTVFAFKDNDRYGVYKNFGILEYTDITPPAYYNSGIKSWGVKFEPVENTIDFFSTYDLSGLEKVNNSDEVYNTLLFVPNTNKYPTLASATTNLTEKEMKEAAIKLDIEYTESKDMQGNTSVPTELNTGVLDIKPGNYIICSYSKDVKGNYLCTPMGFYNKQKYEKKCSLKDLSDLNDTTNYQVLLPSKELSTNSTRTFSIEKFDTTNKKWISVDSDSITSNKVLKTAVDGNFIRITAKEIPYTSGTDSLVKNVVTDNIASYMSVPAYMYGSGSDSGYHSGLVFTELEGSFIIQTTGQEKCLVEVLHSKNNFGSNKDDWEFLCPVSQKINPVLVENNKSYEKNLTGVPSGDWYVIMFHFADGSSKMTTPAQKL